MKFNTLFAAVVVGVMGVAITNAAFSSDGKSGAERLMEAARAMVTDAEVGDAASFGRNVKWLGLVSTGFVQLSSDCTPVAGDPPPGPDDRCVTTNPAPAITTWDFTDLGRITLPGKSAKSFLCHSATPIMSYGMTNGTGVNGTGRFFHRGRIRIESPVLLDPALIDPATSLPYNGGFDVSLPSYRDLRTLEPGEISSQSIQATRGCIAGLVSKKSLVESGLTEAQANEFFKQPITIRIGSSGSSSFVDFAAINFGVRITGD
jgi:hypothetical protein